MNITYRQQQSLQSEIHHKRQKLSLLTQSITNFKTQNSKQEFEIWKLEDDVADLKAKLEQERSNIENLKSFERESLEVLRHKFELKRKEISAEIDHGLHELKESLAEEISQRLEKEHEEENHRHQALQRSISDGERSLQEQKTELNRTLIAIKEEHHRKTLRLEEEAKKAEAVVDSETKKALQAKENLSGSREELSSQISSKRARLKNVQQELANIETRLRSRRDLVSELRLELDAAKKSAADVKNATRTREEETRVCVQDTERMKQAFPALEAQRRVLHEKLQSLKGNIRVFCRIRPNFDGPASDIAVSELFSAGGKQEVRIKAEGSGITSRVSTYSFHFDKVFQNSSNSDIFLEISQLVQSSLDGHNVCVFAYGQTGSGKTHTMSAADGMIPLSVEKIFSDIRSLEDQGWRYCVQGRFLEIYNEQILDLTPGSSAGAKYEIKHDDSVGRTSVTNSTGVGILSAGHCQELFSAASKKRSTASTMANARSSRSHFIFTLEISGSHESGKTCFSTLNLVDLAGSERLASSQARGDRLKETQAINKSLACLGDVIMSLNRGGVQAKSHVPYRNSKLTYYLKHSLGGDSKTLMFVNISPAAQNISETLNSLRFAAKVNETKLGSPVKGSGRSQT